MMITIEQQMRCVEREIAMRRRVYPKWVAKGNMTQEKADHEIAAMVEVLGTLQSVKDDRSERQEPERNETRSA